MDEEGTFGPALPPHLLNASASSNNKVIGPCMPVNFKPADMEMNDSDNDQSDEEDDEDIAIGPLPPGAEPTSRAQLELEERALEIKLNGMEDLIRSSTTDKKNREEWMIELPEVRKVSDLGLGARQFRQREGPDFSDRSSWTDTPESKLEKDKVEPSRKQAIEEKMLKERDKAMEKMKKKYDNEHKREKSLLELHQEKLKKQKKKDKKEKDERRPFSREMDLAVNKFDETRKQAAIKKSKLLDNRFSAGSSKFL